MRWQPRALKLSERQSSSLVLGAAALLCLLLSRVSVESQALVAALGMLLVSALVVVFSRNRRLEGAVVVAFLSLSLIGTVAGPRWTPHTLDTSLQPATTDTRIGSDAETAPVGTYEVETETVLITQADGEEVEALLRRPVGVVGDAPAVVFLHGAGTQSTAGFAGQAQALSSAGAVTLVPSKPMEDYTLTERDYLSMAADYEQSVEYLRQLDGVDSTRVGIYAESEGAYPGVVLVAQDQEIAFVVLASAPIVIPREQAAFASANYLISVGVPPSLLSIIPRGLGMSELPGGGFQYADFDPIAYEEQITQPVLMLYGTADNSMPLIQGPQIIWDAISTNGNTDLTVRYYEGANHGLKSGHSTDGAIMPEVGRDLARWVIGLPQTASATPHVAGATPTQDYWADPVPSTRWYASGDLAIWGLLSGFALIGLSLLIWAFGQFPRLRRRPGLHLPDPLGRWTVSLCLAVLTTWVFYAAYLYSVAEMAMSYQSNLWVSYGGWFITLLAVMGTLFLLVRLTQQMWDMRMERRQLGEWSLRWLTPASWAVLGSARLGVIILLVDLAYWGLFPQMF